MYRHRRVLLNPRYGSLGLLAFPYFFFVELLAPLIEAFGLLALPAALILHAVNWEFALLLFIVAYGYGLVLTLSSLMLEEVTESPYARFTDRLRLIPWAIAESFGYRQMTVVWRLRGLWKYLRKESSWGAMTRSGFATSDGAEEGAG